MTISRRAFCVVAAFAPVLLTVSCRTAPPRMTDATVVPVYYATDRKPLMPLDVWQAKLPKKGSAFAYYGADYNPARLELGVCPISVPTANHQPGVVERPGWAAQTEPPEKYFSITALRPLEPDSFYADLDRRLARCGRREVAVFIHGYNMTFATAALYACQLSWDWDFRGVPILYSWPSHGTLLGYPRDEESARLTQAHLRAFLQGLLARTSATNVHLIAHSLGCRVLTQVLSTFPADPNRRRFGEVVLAAPDVNQVEFLQEMAPVLPRVAKRVSVYASSGDKALEASHSFHQYARVGDAKAGLCLCRGIETIDTSDVADSALGHSYLVRSRLVIADIADVICRGLPPEQRNLTRLNRNGQEYWKLKKAQ